MEAKAEETKPTKTYFGKKLPKHVTKVYIDEDQSPNVLYATVELELADGSSRSSRARSTLELRIIRHSEKSLAMMQREFCTTAK